MELSSRLKRGGDPVACAYGCSVNADKSIRAGLLFVAGNVKGALHMTNPLTGQTFLVTLPPEFEDLTEPGWDMNKLLKGV